MLIPLGHDNYRHIDERPPRKARQRPIVHLGTQWCVIMQIRTSPRSIWFEQEFRVDGAHYNDAARAVLAYLATNNLTIFKPATLFTRIENVNPHTTVKTT